MRNVPHPKTEDLDLARVLYALSDQARLEIVRRLAEAGGPVACGELCLDRPKSSMSHHFRTLREAGIVWTEADGATHLNSLRRADLDARFPGLLDSVLAAAAA